jgi:hypothetical protein
VSGHLFETMASSPQPKTDESGVLSIDAPAQVGHDLPASGEPRNPLAAAIPRKLRGSRVVETIESVADLLRDHPRRRPSGRWELTTDRVTTKTWESTPYGASVTLHSRHPAAEWQVEVRSWGTSYELFEEPVPRRRAVDAAIAHMDQIAVEATQRPTQHR